MYVVYVCLVCTFIQRSDGSRPSRVKSGRLLYPQRSGMATLGWLPTPTNIMSVPHPPLNSPPQSNNPGEQHINKRPTANDCALICILHIHTVYTYTQKNYTNFEHNQWKSQSAILSIPNHSLHIYTYILLCSISQPPLLLFSYSYHLTHSTSPCHCVYCNSM